MNKGDHYFLYGIQACTKKCVNYNGNYIEEKKQNLAFDS